MTAETRAPVDLVTRMQEAASAAIADCGPAIVEAGPGLRLLTVEVEVTSKGAVVGATAWLERRVSVSKLLGVRG